MDSVTETLKCIENDKGTPKDCDIKRAVETSKESDDSQHKTAKDSVGSSTCESHDDKQELEADLKIFGYELYNYFMARCFYNTSYPQPIQITEGSKFTEEFGKAVILAWHKAGKKYIEMLQYDYPRFIAKTDNFKRYVLFKVQEMIREYEITKTEQIIMIAAFLFDIYICCVAIDQYRFLPNFSEYWCELISANFDEFIKNEGWETMSKMSVMISKQYDEEKIEETVDLTEIRINIKYFIKIDGADSTYSAPKKVSRFYTLSQTFKDVLPSNYPGELKNRRETLYIISTSNMQDEFFEVLNDFDCFMGIFLRPYVLKVPKEQVQKKTISKNQRKRMLKKEKRL